MGSEVLCGELVFSLWTICVLGWTWKIRAFVACVSGVLLCSWAFCWVWVFFLLMFEKGCHL